MIKKSTVIADLASALSAAQGEMPQPPKTATNPFFKSKYADLSSVLATALPVLAKHDLAVSQLVAGDEERSTLTTILMHASGQYIHSTMPLFLKDQTPQGQGSAITYARRYAFMAILGMVGDEDDDGNAAQGGKSAVPVSQMITPPQIKKIAVMMPQSGKYENIADYETKTGKKINSFTKTQASDLIAKLTGASMAKVVEDNRGYTEQEPEINNEDLEMIE